MCIIGPSGAGKSTYLRSLNELEMITSGKIYIKDELFLHRENDKTIDKIDPVKQKEMLLEMGMVFQRFNLFPHLTVLENICIAPMKVKKVPRAQIERIVRTFPGIVVLDEAYIDFADTPGLLGELDRFPNLIILQTLSKAWGMAGLRLGLAFAQEEIVETLSRVKYPYNINVITQRAVLEQLETSIDGQVAEIVSERERVAEALRTLPAVRKIYPSQANFLLARFDDPRGVYERLIGEGIIVRDRSRVAGCEGCLRITIGTPAQNDRLIETLKNETA